MTIDWARTGVRMAVIMTCTTLILILTHSKNPCGATTFLSVALRRGTATVIALVETIFKRVSVPGRRAIHERHPRNRPIRSRPPPSRAFFDILCNRCQKHLLCHNRSNEEIFIPGQVGEIPGQQHLIGHYFSTLDTLRYQYINLTIEGQLLS